MLTYSSNQLARVVSYSVHSNQSHVSGVLNFFATNLLNNLIIVFLQVFCAEYAFWKKTWRAKKHNIW